MDYNFEYQVSFNKLKATEPFLKEYFGVSYGYFSEEIQNSDRHECIKLKYPNSYQNFIGIFQDEGIAKLLPFNNENLAVIYALFIMSHVFIREHFGSDIEYDYDEFDEGGGFDMDNYMDDYYDIKAKKDLLKLYIFSIQKIRNKPVAEQIVIRYNLNEKIELENVDNWFAKVLLSNHLDKYLPDIHSVEQAKEELKKLRNVAGRKMENPYSYILIYGVYSMVTTHLKLNKIPNSLCNLITRLLLFVDFIDEDEADNRDSLYTRSLINYLIGRPAQPKFNSREPVMLSFEEISGELKTSGRFLYEKMYR